MSQHIVEQSTNFDSDSEEDRANNEETGTRRRTPRLDDVQDFLIKHFTETGVNMAKITPGSMRNALNSIGLPDVTMKVQKNNALSVEYRLLGNEQYKKDNFKEALRLYNKSLCFAEVGSENEGYGYANRSAVYYKLNRYETTIKNIKLAKKFKYPEQLLPKLMERKDKCVRNIRVHRPIGQKRVHRKDDSKMKLSYDSNPKNPCVVNRIKMEQRPGYGRCLVATDDLKVGDIIISDQTFYDGYYDSSTDKYLKCDYCGAENFHDLIPCPECTSVMYCDKRCQRDAYQNYHIYECCMIDGLVEYIGFRDLYMQSIRIFWSVITHYYDDLSKLFTVLKKDVNPLEINYEKDSFEETFLAFYSYKSIDGEAYKSFTVNGSVLFRLISDYSNIRDKISNPELSRVLCELLCNITRIVNIVEFFDSPGRVDVWPVISLINHACFPNAMLLNKKDKSWKNIIVKRPIKKGEQITLSYR
jgi:tetratricopeptide (TPR) repeat protein